MKQLDALYRILCKMLNASMNALSEPNQLHKIVIQVARRDVGDLAVILLSFPSPVELPFADCKLQQGEPT